MVTLAFAQMLYFIANQWRGVTGGENGLHPQDVFGIELVETDSFYFYYAAIPIILLGVFIAWRIVNSPFGRVLVAIRDNPARARALGYDVERYKIMVFVLSAGLAGLAGGVFSISHGFGRCRSWSGRRPARSCSSRSSAASAPCGAGRSALPWSSCSNQLASSGFNRHHHRHDLRRHRPGLPPRPGAPPATASTPAARPPQEGGPESSPAGHARACSPALAGSPAGSFCRTPSGGPPIAGSRASTGARLRHGVAPAGAWMSWRGGHDVPVDTSSAMSQCRLRPERPRGSVCVDTRLRTSAPAFRATIPAHRPRLNGSLLAGAADAVHAVEEADVPLDQRDVSLEPAREPSSPWVQPHRTPCPSRSTRLRGEPENRLEAR